MTTGDDAARAFAAHVGGVDAGPVVAVGGGSAGDLGGAVAADARPVKAPAGVVEHVPAEMTVRVRAGTTVASLDRMLAEAGQCVALPALSEASTVGGVLAAGRSGLRRLGWGPVRDTVLEITAVLADGRLVKAGGPTVKNVTGYDLCRLLVGSLGTLALIAEVVVRTRPLPPAERWCEVPGGPEAVAGLYRPAAALWDGTTTWVLLDGHPDDIDAQIAAHGLVPLPARPADLGVGLDQRWSMPVAHLSGLPADGHGPFLAQLGVGIVHRATPQPPPPVDPAVRRLHERLKAAFDPTGRLAPGRSVLPD